MSSSLLDTTLALSTGEASLVYSSIYANSPMHERDVVPTFGGSLSIVAYTRIGEWRVLTSLRRPAWGLPVPWMGTGPLEIAVPGRQVYSCLGLYADNDFEI